jgi:hypothetical protein
MCRKEAEKKNVKVYEKTINSQVLFWRTRFLISRFVYEPVSACGWIEIQNFALFL